MIVRFWKHWKQQLLERHVRGDRRDSMMYTDSQWKSFEISEVNSGRCNHHGCLKSPSSPMKVRLLRSVWGEVKYIAVIISSKKFDISIGNFHKKFRFFPSFSHFIFSVAFKNKLLRTCWSWITFVSNQWLMSRSVVTLCQFREPRRKILFFLSKRRYIIYRVWSKRVRFIQMVKETEKKLGTCSKTRNLSFN